MNFFSHGYLTRHPSVNMPASGALTMLANGEQTKPDQGGLNTACVFYRPLMSSDQFDPKQDVLAYREYVTRHGPELEGVPEGAKNNRKAKQLRVRAKQLVNENQLWEALHTYGASVCWAEPGSSAVGSGYAGRAAVYHKLREYEYSLINTKLAKENGYPKQHWPIVDRYEQDCRTKLQAGLSKSAGHDVPDEQGLNVETNPKIPFLAKGIRTEEFLDYGRGLIAADREFTSGDVILHEKPMVAAVHQGAGYGKCSFCTTSIMPRMVPCPDCVTAVYCGQRCLEEDQKLFHRYECGVMAKLQHISCCSFPLGPRMFLYGLALFNGDLNQFMEFCKANPRTGSDPLELDYTNPDRLEEFKAFHRAKEPPTEFDYNSLCKFYAALYYSIFTKQPQVASLLRTPAQKDFFTTQMLDYIRMATILHIGRPAPYDRLTTQHFSIASLCNHACNPNTMSLYHAGHLKLIVIRRIRKGQQITIPYIPPLEEMPDRQKRVHDLSLIAQIETCFCDLCDTVKLATLNMIQLMGRRSSTTSGGDSEQPSLANVVRNDRIDGEELRKFCAQFLRDIPSEDMDVREMANSYRLKLGMAFIENVENEARSKETVE